MKDKLKALQHKYTCGHGCYFGEPTGMSTNGGCRCMPYHHDSPSILSKKQTRLKDFYLN